MFVPALLPCLKQYDRQTLIHDLLAGLTVGVIALPLAMAFAIASGVPPERGIFTAIIAGFLISALGGSRTQIGGPTGAFVVIVAGIHAKFGYDGLVMSMLLASGFLLALGLFRMGALIKFIPFPVVTGFTTGIALVILTTQIKDLLGLTMAEAPAEFVQLWIAYIKHLPTINPQAAALGLSTIAIIVLVRRRWPRLPAMLIGMAAATAAAWALGLEIETIGSRFGELPRSLPRPSLPTIDLAMIPQLISPAFTIGLLAAIESLLSATVADGMTGDRHNSNMELVAQGVANTASAIFGGIPATGALARTATSIRGGARTPVAGLIHALTLLLMLLLFAPLARMIPLTALAAILVVVAWNMSELHHFKRLLDAPRSDVMVLLTTFALTVLVDLTVAVEVGVVLASLLFIRRMAEVTNVGMITREFKENGEPGDDPNAIALREVPPGVEVFEINGPFFFGAADSFKQTMREIERPPRVIILRMRAVPAIDATGLHVLEEFMLRGRREGSELVLSGVHAQPLMAMTNNGLLDKLGEDNVHGHIDDALDRAREILGLPPIERQFPFVPNVRRDMDRPTPAGASK